MAKQMSIKAFAAAHTLATCGTKNGVSKLATAMLAFVIIDHHSTLLRIINQANFVPSPPNPRRDYTPMEAWTRQ
jgi:hypothetical protein